MTILNTSITDSGGEQLPESTASQDPVVITGGGVANVVTPSGSVDILRRQFNDDNEGLFSSLKNRQLGIGISGAEARIIFKSQTSSRYDFLSQSASDLRYAALSHTHAASDITSGFFTVARGGTGRSTLTSNTVLVGNGTSEVSLVSRSGIDTRTIFPTDASTHNHDSVYGRLASENNWTAPNIFSGSAGFIAFHTSNRGIGWGDDGINKFIIKRNGEYLFVSALNDDGSDRDDPLVIQRSSAGSATFNRLLIIPNATADAHALNRITGDGRYAALSHTHAAADITSGFFAVARGGTGRSTLTSNTVLVGNGTSAVSLVSRSGIDTRTIFPTDASTHNHDEINGKTGFTWENDFRERKIFAIAQNNTGSGQAVNFTTTLHVGAGDTRRNFQIASSYSSTNAFYMRGMWDNGDGGAGAYKPWEQLVTVPLGDGRYAALSHTHAASDITSGFFTVARGGTGRGTLDAGSVLVGNGTSAVSLVSRSGIDTRTIFPTDASTHNHDSVYGRLAASNTWTAIQTYDRIAIDSRVIVTRLDTATENTFSFILRTDGTLEWAALNSASRDVFLRRSASGILALGTTSSNNEGLLEIGNATANAHALNRITADGRYAALSHTHAASDITSGSFSVARGGTGRSTLTSDTVLVGNGTSAVSLTSRSGIDTRTIFPTDASTHNHDAVYGRLAASNTWTGVNDFSSSSGTDVLTTRVTGDASPRFSIDTLGKMKLADAGGGYDTLLERFGAGMMQLGTNDSVPDGVFRTGAIRLANKSVFPVGDDVYLSCRFSDRPSVRFHAGDDITLRDIQCDRATLNNIVLGFATSMSSPDLGNIEILGGGIVFHRKQVINKTSIIDINMFELPNINAAYQIDIFTVSTAGGIASPITAQYVLSTTEGTTSDSYTVKEIIEYPNLFGIDVVVNASTGVKTVRLLSSSINANYFCKLLKII